MVLDKISFVVTSLCLVATLGKKATMIEALHWGNNMLSWAFHIDARHYLKVFTKYNKCRRATVSSNSLITCEQTSGCVLFYRKFFMETGNFILNQLTVGFFIR